MIFLVHLDLSHSHIILILDYHLFFIIKLVTIFNPRITLYFSSFKNYHIFTKFLDSKVVTYSLLKNHYIQMIKNVSMINNKMFLEPIYLKD